MTEAGSSIRQTGIWRDARFRRYWMGQSISEVGDRVSELGLPVVAVTMLDASPIEVGALFAAIWTPNLVSLFVGAWVDRLPSKKRVLVIANLIQAAAILCVPIAYFADALSMPVLYSVAIVGGLGGVLFHTAYPSFFVLLVKREQFVEANSLLSTTRSASFIAGPPLAGALIRLLTAPVALLVDGSSFLLSALMISRVTVDEHPHETPLQETYRRRLRLGVKYLRQHRYLRASLACSTTLNFFFLMVQAVLILYASRVLDLGAGSIGLAFGIGAIGGIVGAATAGQLSRWLGTGRTIATGAILFTIPFALLPLAEGGPLALRIGVIAAAEFISGFGIMIFDINNNSLQAAVTDDTMRSRVSGAYATVNYGIRPLGALLGGWTAEHIGIPSTIVIASIAGTLAFIWLLKSPVIHVRRVDDLRPHLVDLS